MTGNPSPWGSCPGIKWHQAVLSLWHSLVFFQMTEKRLTWIRDRMLAKCVSIAPPLGKFWLILFIRWLKQL